MSTPRTAFITRDVPLLNQSKPYARLINSLLSGKAWGNNLDASKPISITFSYPWENGSSAVFTGYKGASYSIANEENATYRFGFDQTQQLAVSAALQTWADLANLRFAQVQSSFS